MPEVSNISSTLVPDNEMLKSNRTDCRRWRNFKFTCSNVGVILEYCTSCDTGEILRSGSAAIMSV